MKKYLLMTTAAGAALSLSAPAYADGYFRVFGGGALFDDQNIVLNDVGPTYSVTSRYWPVQIPVSPTSSFVPLYPQVYRSTITSTATFPYGTLKTVNFVRFNTAASGTFTSKTNGSLSVDSGFVIGAAAGIDLGNGISFEIEMAYRRAKADGTFSFQSYRNVAGLSSYKFYQYNVYHVSATYTTTLSVPATPTTLPSLTYQIPHFPSESNVRSSTIYAKTTTPILRTGSTANTWTDTGNLSSFSVMANVWWDMNPNGKIHPYVGAGLGWANVDIDLNTLSVSDSAIAFQVGAGLGYDLSDHVRIDIEYRYFTLPQLEMVSPKGFDMEMEYNVSEVVIGFRYRF